MFVFTNLCFAQISPDLLTLPDRLTEVLGGLAGSSAADWGPVSEDQGAAQAVRVACHPAEVARGGGGGGGVAGLMVRGEGVALGEVVGVGREAGQLLACQLSSPSWGDSVHSGGKDNLKLSNVK